LDRAVVRAVGAASGDGAVTSLEIERRVTVNVQERIEVLKAKHTELETAIEEEGGRPLPDSGRMAGLKRQKLRIKDKIADLSRH